jgi:hypothetical protein
MLPASTSIAIGSACRALLAAAIVAGSPAAAQAEVGRSPQAPGETRHVKGRLLVQARAGLKLLDLDGILHGHAARRLHAISQLNAHIVELPEQASERAVAQALSRNPHIKFAEVDRELRPAFTPNDSGYAISWQLPKIGSPSAWDYSSGSGVTIAILDSGVDPAHPDLVENLVAGYNIFDDNTDTRDVYGHGTLVAGAAAMAGNNLIGSAGVAYAARIMPIRVTDTAGFARLSTLASGLVWAADHGARVASMSFLEVCGSPTVLSAAQYMRGKGGVVTGAAGNTGVEEPIAPSDAVTCVAASDADDRKADFSSWGAYVDVAAPGVSIYSSTSGGGYDSASGTSFSAPITAGVYALMIAANPQLAPSELDAALFSTAADLGTAGKDVQFGFGRVNAGAAVEKVSTSTPRDTTPPSVSIASPAPGSQVNGLVALAVTASDNVGVTRVDLYAGGRLVGSDLTAPYGFTWDSTERANGSTTLEAKAFDAAGNVGSNRVTVSVANTVGVVNSTAHWSEGLRTSLPIAVASVIQARGAAASSLPQSTNFALASAGAVASASSAYAGYPASSVNDGQRTGAGWGRGGAWNDATGGEYPDWVQVAFDGVKRIDRVVVYTLQDDFSSPVEPEDTTTFSLYGVVDFTVQGWNGSAWVTLAGVAGNNLVKRTVNFAPFTTDRVRIHITSALGFWSRITELEAWGR